MKEENIPIKNKKGLNKKHKRLLLDTILVLIPFVVPHTSILAAIICVGLIVFEFHKLRKKEEED